MHIEKSSMLKSGNMSLSRVMNLSIWTKRLVRSQSRKLELRKRFYSRRKKKKKMSRSKLRKHTLSLFLMKLLSWVGIASFVTLKLNSLTRKKSDMQVVLEGLRHCVCRETWLMKRIRLSKLLIHILKVKATNLLRLKAQTKKKMNCLLLKKPNLLTKKNRKNE